MKPLLITLLALVLGIGAANAQLEQPVTWSYAAKKVSATEAVIYIKATIDEGWHLYSQNIKPGGPVASQFTFKPAAAYTLIGKVKEPKPIVKNEKVFNMEVAYFEDSAVFQQKIKLKGKKPFQVKGSVEFMVCNDTQCLPPTEVVFNIPVK